MLGLEKKYPMLFEKRIMGAANFGVFSPIVVFLMDRVVSSDNKLTQEESVMFDQLSHEYGALFGIGSSSFMVESIRICNIYENFIHSSEDARMTWEAVEFVGNEFNYEEKVAMVDILERLATCDKYLDNKELSIFYAVVMACHSEIDSINKIFTQLYERIVKMHTADHQMAKALMILINFISEDPKNVKLTILGTPDPKLEGNIPPVFYTYEEFADWITVISLARATKQRNAFMNQTRVFWKMGPIVAQKGLIKFCKIQGSEDKQIHECIESTRAWCNAIKKGIGNVPFPNDQIVEIFVFGDNDDTVSDAVILNQKNKGIWKITCKKITSGFELHAFDITGDPITYWCPDAVSKLEKKIPIDKHWVNGSFPINQNERNEIINKIIASFK